MGLIQKSFGDVFERLFQARCHWFEGLALTRFPDGCRVVGKNNLVRIKTPCDFILTFEGKTALLDTKTTDSDTFPHSKICIHQVSEMLKHTQVGALSGYVIWFRKSDQVFFANAYLLSKLINKRGSIKPEDLLFLGKETNFNPLMIFRLNEV